MNDPVRLLPFVQLGCANGEINEDAVRASAFESGEELLR
jgi:hypothetical protein